VETVELNLEARPVMWSMSNSERGLEVKQICAKFAFVANRWETGA
jgi:hypothetical protein